MLEVRHLECIRGERSLFTPITFRLQAGELLYLRGDNGSGKTSVLRMLCGLFLPASGQILWRGLPINEWGEEYWRELSFLGHHNAIKDELTPLENLLTSTGLTGVFLDEARALMALDELGLSGYEELPCRYLSQGQKRRVALARLVNEPRPLWLLDEPFVALDSAITARVARLIVAHLQRGGLIILTTHQEIKIDVKVAHELTLVPWQPPC